MSDGSPDLPPPIRVSAWTWELDVQPATIQQVATAWRTLAAEVRARADSLVQAARDPVADWSGYAREAFVDHRGRLIGDLDEVAALADDAAAEVDEVAGTAVMYQTALDGARAAIIAAVPSQQHPNQVEFQPADDQQAQAVAEAITVAEGLREGFRSALVNHSWPGESEGFAEIARRWRPVASGDREPFVAPSEATDAAVLWVDGRVVINTGSDDDDVRVWRDPGTGEIVVLVNGAPHTYPPGTPVTIRGGAGDDVIEVEPGVGANLVLLGGEGRDRLRGSSGNDILLGLAGKDDLFDTGGDNYVSGGGSRDYVELTGTGDDRTFGGEGNDVLYDLSGERNVIAGGAGDDNVVAGVADDTVDGGAGRDVIFPGSGDNVVRGGRGGDVLYGGSGQNLLDGGGGEDTAYPQTGDRVTDVDPDRRTLVDYSGWRRTIQVEGSPEFVARVQADLDALGSSPTGQAMLERLGELRGEVDGHLTIREQENDALRYRPNEGGGEAGERGTTTARGDDIEILYNPSFTFDRHAGDPLTVLYHELAHVYGYWNGNIDMSGFGVPQDGVARAEYQAVGLPYDRSHPFAEPSERVFGTDPAQPERFTENGWREETGRPRRTEY